MNLFKLALLALTTLTLLTGLSACGGSEDTNVEPQTDTEVTTIVHDASAIAEHIGLDENNYVETDGVTCEAAVILTSAGMVATYRDAGDTVATNPDGTAGVKNVSSEKNTCQTFFEEKLADFPQG